MVLDFFKFYSPKVSDPFDCVHLTTTFQLWK